MKIWFLSKLIRTLEYLTVMASLLWAVEAYAKCPTNGQCKIDLSKLGQKVEKNSSLNVIPVRNPEKVRIPTENRFKEFSDAITFLDQYNCSNCNFLFGKKDHPDALEPMPY